MLTFDDGSSREGPSSDGDASAANPGEQSTLKWSVNWHSNTAWSHTLYLNDCAMMENVLVAHCLEVHLIWYRHCELELELGGELPH